MKEPKTSYTEKIILGEEEKAIADKASKLIARDYSETLRKLAEYEEENRIDAKYRKKIVK